MRRFRFLLVVIVLAVSLVSGTAAAQSATEAPPTKRPGLSLGLSVGLPIAGYGMIAAAVLPSGHIQSWQKLSFWLGLGLALVGPSGGHFYNRQIPRAFAFSGARLALAVTSVVFVAEAIRKGDVSEADYDKGASKRAMTTAALCGAGIVLLSIWESIDAYYSAKRLAHSPRRALAVAPILGPGPQGEILAGLSLAGSY